MPRQRILKLFSKLTCHQIPRYNRMLFPICVCGGGVEQAVVLNTFFNLSTWEKRQVDRVSFRTGRTTTKQQQKNKFIGKSPIVRGSFINSKFGLVVGHLVKIAEIRWLCKMQ